MCKPIITVLILATMMVCNACQHTALTAPCKQFGRYCHKVPINSWDYQAA